MQGAIQDIIDGEKREYRHKQRAKYGVHKLGLPVFEDPQSDYNREEALERYRNTLSK